MATDQVRHWISRDVKLSQVINSFETDFSNGYLFGEILCQYGIYQDISIFSKKTNKEARVNNFYLIEDALRALKVRFDGKLTHNIMQEERGAALRLLYQLKLAIQKREGPAPDETEAQTMTGLKAGTVNRKLQQKMEFTNTIAGSIKPRLVGTRDMRTKNQKMQDSHLIKFEVAQKQLFDDALAQAGREKNLVGTIQQNKRQDNIDKLKDNQDFMKEWEQEGRQNWKKNQNTRANNIARQKYFEDREVNLFKEKLNRELVEATGEMRNGFSEFEKNLQKLGIDSNINIDDAIKRQEEKQGIPPGQIQNFSFPATMNKIKETKKQSDFAGKERERRRRKLAVDQANTQTRLDKQKEEDTLIQKLLKQQQEEQNNAYQDERLRKCKTMLTNQRRSKALDVQAKMEVKYKAMEEQSKREAVAREADRKIQIERQKDEYAKIHRQTKLGKRHVNIEIASGVVDLIMDLADEVFDVTQDQKGKKMTKAQWREFSEIFVDGKKVSLRNFKKQIVEAGSLNKSEQEGYIRIPKGVSAVEALNVFKKEQALHDLYQFISNSGLFNLGHLKGDLLMHWARKLNIENFLGQGIGQIQENPDLGKLVETLYKNHQSLGAEFAIQMQSVRGTSEEIKEDVEYEELSKLPTDLPLKLAILGRAFSGKKTIATQLQEKYGGEKNIKVFKMDEIIKEALEYITPKKVDEAALEAAKKAKKGKVEEMVNVDVFEGKDTEEYKKTATQIKSSFFPDFEGELPQKVDLTSLVFDDGLLVNLFVERLKLEYEGVDLNVADSEIEAGIIREKELVEQLAEMEDSQVAPADEKKKGGKGTAKGGKGGATDESLKDELDTIRSLQKKGWILIDFPRNLDQMKMLETCFSGYVASTDLPKDQNKQKKEAWSQVISPQTLVDASTTGEVKALSSGFDGVIILNTPDEECKRRATGRKIDPQTAVIYHMETEAPEDSKVLDRLQDYEDEAGGEDRQRKISSGFNQSISAIKQWLTRFGLSSPDGTCQVQLDIDIKMQASAPVVGEDGETKESKDPWKAKDDVLSAVMDRVQKICDYRQHQFQLRRDQVKAAMEERERKEAERQKELAEKEAASQEKDATSNQEASPKNESKTARVPNIETSNEDDIPQAMQTISSSKKLLSEQQHSVGGTSKSYARSSKFFQRVQEISDKQKLTKWEDHLAEYYTEGMQEFNAMRLLRQRVCRSLNETQLKFISYLGRKSDQQRRINEYCENYNRFSREFPDLIGNPETKKELQNRINILSQQLWEDIKMRKEESLQERQSYMEGGWVQIEMVKLCSSIAKLIENEFRRFSTISAVVTGHLINEDIDLEQAVKKLTERGTEPYIENIEDRSQIGESPLLLEIASTILTKVDALFNEQHVLSLDHKILLILNTERQNFSMRLNLLFSWATLILQEISNQAFQVFDILDDWVVIAVKRENLACKQAEKEITQAIEMSMSHLETIILPGVDLESHIETIEFYEGPPQYMMDAQPICTLDQARFSLPQLDLVYKQMRENQEDMQLMDSQTFLSLVIKNMQFNNLPQVWRYVTFEHLFQLAQKMEAKPLSDNPNSQAGSVKLFRGKNSSTDASDQPRVFIDWRKAFLMFALMAGQIPTEEEKQTYYSKLRAKMAACKDGLLSKDSFIQIEAWFDRTEGAIIPMTAPPAVSPSPSMSIPPLTPNSFSPSEVGNNEASIDEDDELGDQERLEAVKALLFDTYRIQNKAGMLCEEFIRDLDYLFRSQSASKDDQQTITLYHTLLRLPL